MPFASFCNATKNATRAAIGQDRTAALRGSRPDRSPGGDRP
jgi:hypothetical protein